MGSYYREHVSYPNVTAGPYPQQLVSAVENDNPNDHAASPDAARDNADARECTVKGCSAMLPLGYPNKMCDECRGRHRIYAMTKRAKRKMEKALLNGSNQNGQSVVWMPMDDAHQEVSPQSPERTASPSRQFQVAPMEDDNTQQFDYSQTWDPRAIDPRLFSQTSELAGALTLPPPPQLPASAVFTGNDNSPPRPSSQQPSESAVPPPPAAPEIHPILAEVLKAMPGLNLSTRVTSGPTVPVSASASSVDGPLPPRFCSIKGCKTLIPGNSFFKMCEPCRDRYRNYGTTKRAKWKREKEVVVAELHNIRTDEDGQPLAHGLPPLPPETNTWPDYSPPASAGADSSDASNPPMATGDVLDASGSPPPRMCTVSHCREILPGNYNFLRCERHRIQNRHHSKLKRVRDKEVKAQVYDGWAAAVGARATSNLSMDESAGSVVSDASPDGAPSASDLVAAFGDMQTELRDGSIGPDFTGIGAEQLEDTPLGEPSAGLPPAARGTRRTNHVCSIKACANLLSPSNPWKMCDLCRSRDRAGRRIKALRDNGLISPELAEGKIGEVRMEVEGREGEKGKGKGKRKGKGKKKVKGKNGEGEVADLKDQSEEGEQGASGTSANVCQQPFLPHALSLETAIIDSPIVGTPNGSIAPSALHHRPLETHQSVFNNVPVPSHADLVFMEPTLGDIASGLQRHLGQQAGGQSMLPNPPRPSKNLQVDNPVPEIVVDVTPDCAPVPASLPKKRAQKAKAKHDPQPNEDITVHSSQKPSTDPDQSTHIETNSQTNTSESTNPSALAVDVASTAGPSHIFPTQSHPPPPPTGHLPYPYYIPSYVGPHGTSPTYAYCYPPPPKGSYVPPSMYQPPYGSVPYPFPYPGQPYPYLGQPYAPPTNTPYSLPTSTPYSPPLQPYSSPEPSLPQTSPAQPYGPQLQPYPYMHSLPPPPPLSSLQQQSPSSDSPVQPPRPQILSHSKSSRSPSQPTNGSEPTQKPATFIVRTSETYSNPTMYPSKALFSVKRKREDSDVPASKRAELEAAGTYSTFRISLSTTPSDVYADNVQAWQMHSADVVEGAQAQVTSVVEVENNGVEEGTSAMTHCSNKTCKRMVTSGLGGCLCDRCRERLKKKQSKAKHRFKLEPRTLIGRAIAAGGRISS